MKLVLKMLILICTLFFSLAGTAQNTATLKVGDPAPPLKVYSWIKGEPVRSLDKGRIYVIELGATWCKPCFKAIPELTALAKKYERDVTVVGIFVMESQRSQSGPGKPQYVERVEKYVEKQGKRMEYHVGVDFPDKQVEKTWIRSANKNSVPVTFIIDRQGRIAWIGANTTAMKAIVQRVCSPDYDISQALAWADASAKTTPYDPSKLLLVDGNGGTSADILYRSVLTAYKGDIKTPPPLFVSNKSQAKKSSPSYSTKGIVQATGASLPILYQLAYSDTLWNQVTMRTFDGVFRDSKTNPYQKSAYGTSWYEPILEVADPSPFETTYRDPTNKYNYSLKIPLEKNTAFHLQQAMRRDLKTYFGYEVVVERRLMPCWKLKATKNAHKLLATKTPGMKYRKIIKENGIFEYKNALIKDILARLGNYYGFGMLNYGRLPSEDIAPFIDETDITYEIDFHVDTNKLDFKSFQKLLADYGLYLEKGQQPMKVVIIRDP